MNTIVGRITRNAEIRTLENHKQVVNFSVAINENYKTKDGERREQTTYFNCAYWLSPKVAEYLTKGTLVELSGRPSASAWIGKDGDLKAGLNFHTSRIKIHGGGKKGDESQNFQQNATPKVENPFSDETEDDLPF